MWRRRITTYVVPALASFWVGVLLATAAWASDLEGCSGPYKGGRQPTPEALAQTLSAHVVWLLSPHHPEAQRANLCGADLRGVRLSDANLVRADLRGVTLARALLGRANLRQADLRQANLQKAILGEANLQQASLQQANLSGAYLAGANFQGADLSASNLREAMLSAADLREARLSSADLRRAVATHANFARARLRHTDLREANLRGVHLGAAALIDVRLQGARLMGSEFAAVVFEPDLVMLPPAAHFALVRNLSRMTFQTSPHGLMMLREIFKQAGLHQQERALTFAIHHALGRQAHPVEGAVRLVFFELTCAYGMAPGRPLGILAGLVGCGALPYILRLRRAGARQRAHSSTWWHTWRHWAVLVLAGLCLSSAVSMRLGPCRTPFDHWLRCVPPDSGVAPLPRWLHRLAALQGFSSLYLVLLWAVMRFAQPFT